MGVEGKVLIIDLDGTLLDVKKRWLKLHQYVAKRLQVEISPKKQYLDLKRQAIDEAILFRSRISKEDYAKLRSKLIERNDFLGYDKLKVGVKGTLATLSKKNVLILLTRRKHIVNCKRQLMAFGIGKFFSRIIITEDKEKEIRSLVKEWEKSRIVIVGDTEAEYLAAKRFGLKCILVSDGARSKEYLKGMRGGQIIDRITQLTSDNIWN